MFKDILKEFWTYARFVISSLFDAAFLVAWYWVQVMAGRWSNGDPLDLIDSSSYLVFRIVFAIITFAPILGFMVVDTYRTYRQVRLRLNEIRIETELRNLDDDSDD